MSAPDRPVHPDVTLDQVVRAETAHLVAALHRLVGDLDVAEEAVAEAVVEALRAWRRDGVPPRPGAWLQLAARRNALDRLRREARHRGALARLAAAGAVSAPAPDGPGGDDRLGLVFACCHPALALPARVALTLRAVAGLTTAEIARAWLVPEATVAQRIVRAKRKIVQAGISLRVPDATELPERLDAVLTVVYLVFNEAHLTTGGPDPARRDLAEDAVWLAGTVAALLPGEPEALGLLALLTLHHARAAARFDAAGRLVLLADQDRARWDATAIGEGLRLLGRAAAHRRPGRFQLEAAIAACHAEAPTWAATDWSQVLVLYDLLAYRDRSPVVRLNRAIALSFVDGPAAALAELDTVAEPLRQYHLFHATHAELLRCLGRHPEARIADAIALRLTRNPAEQHLLHQRLLPP